MTGLEISEHNGNGFKALVNFEGWRVAILNYFEWYSQEKIHILEKHLYTDEVFVLLEGTAVLIIGEELTQYKMEPNKLYNVKKGTYHAVCMKQDAKILLVENEGTGRDNSEYLKADIKVDFE